MKQIRLLFELIGYLILFVLVLPFAGLAYALKYSLRFIFGYDIFDKKDRENYLRGRHAGLRVSLVACLILGILLFIPWWLWQNGMAAFRERPVPAILEMGISIVNSAVCVFTFAMVGVFYTNSVRYVGFRGWPGMPEIRQVVKIRMLKDKSSPVLIFIPGIAGMAFLIAVIFSDMTWMRMVYWFVVCSFLIYMTFSWFVPPLLLFLSTSEENKLIMQARINRTLLTPVASLLDSKVPLRNKISFFDSTNIYRTYDGSRWKESVLILMQLCPVIVMDTRNVTGPVLDEAKMIFDNGFEQKTLFIVGENREHPVLDQFFLDNLHHLDSAVAHNIQSRFFSDDALIDLLNDKKRIGALIAGMNIPVEKANRS